MCADGAIVRECGIERERVCVCCAPHSGALANTVKQTHAICNDDDRDDDDGL